MYMQAYHEHVPINVTDGYIEDTGVAWVVCRDIKVANTGLRFRLQRVGMGKDVCVCVHWERSGVWGKEVCLFAMCGCVK